MDQFSEYKDFYRPDFDPKTNPVPRPQPIDYVVSFFQGKRHGFFIDIGAFDGITWSNSCLLYTSPSPRDTLLSRMPSSA